MTITTHPTVSIEQVVVEHHESGFGIGSATPRLSWRFGETDISWSQTGYEIVVIRDGKQESYSGQGDQSTLVAWPSSPLVSRERAQVRVRALGSPNTDWATASIEVGLLERHDWKAHLISGAPQPENAPKRPFRLLKAFDAPSGKAARIYATAHGIYTLELNGKPVGDQVLMPGWQSYKHHLNYQVFDIGHLLKPGRNEIVADIGEGWFAGRLHRPGRRNNWGTRLGLFAQVEVDGQVIAATDDTWQWAEGPITDSEIYAGETVDTRRTTEVRGPVEVLAPPTAALIAPDAPPVRRVMELRPIEIVTTPSGKKVLDFGQNLVGWIRVERQFDGPGELVMRHAEVLEDGEMGMRPLRTAKCTDTLTLGGVTKGWEPKFTFHGFRYAEISGVDFTLADFTAIVVSSDLRRTGTFDCSHAAITKLHQNVVWGMRGNFVSVPTDCPQRDERLGWTGDIQVFTPTANFLFDTYGFLAGWMRDVEVEQIDADGCVPVVIPWVRPTHSAGPNPRPHAIWGDVTAITPDELYKTFGDVNVLAVQFESMCMWLDKGIPRGDDGLWDQSIRQYGDWLDPRAPPQYPAHGGTDTHLVANAYLVHTTGLVARIAATLGRDAHAKRYASEFAKLRALFHEQYITPKGRLASDTQTAYVLALHFGLLDPAQRAEAVARLEWLIRFNAFKISTGFAGTPLILSTLAENNLLHLAYRMLQERDNPSWLYSVGMGATTIWERWDSMLPDGKINPGTMTSFNHYALGAVADFLHAYVGGLSAEVPGWKRALVRPVPGGTVTSARVKYDSVYGLYAVEWELEGGKLQVRVRVPPNAKAHVVLPGVDEVVPSGVHRFEVDWEADKRWPPAPIVGAQSSNMPNEFVP